MTDALGDFVDLLVGGITSIGSGIASGANAFVESLFLKSSSGTVSGLSTFGGVIAIFGGVGLAISFTTLIFNWVRSIGN